MLRVSDLLLWLLVTALLQCLTFTIVFYVWKGVSQKLSVKQIEKFFKGSFLYIAFLLPVFSGFSLLRLTYIRFERIPDNMFMMWEGEKRIGSQFQISWAYETLGTITRLGNHWILVTLLVLMITWLFLRETPYWQYRRWVLNLRHQTDMTDAKLERLVGELKDKLGIRKKIYLRIVRNMDRQEVEGPFAAGMIRYTIFFPDRNYTIDDCELLLWHELIHCQKCDSLYREILALWRNIYFFHPHLSMMIEEFIENNEMSCDESVWEGCTKVQRVRYAKLLASSGQGEMAFFQGPAFAQQKEKFLIRRLENMKNMNRVGKEKQRWNRGMIVVLTSLLLAAGPGMSVIAAAGMLAVQDAVLQTAFRGEMEDMDEMDKSPEITDFGDTGNLKVEGVSMGARGLWGVDITIKGTAVTALGTESLGNGAKITVVLWGDNSSDKFRAGYIDSSQKRTYVESSNGEINHTFTISKNDTYRFFVQGLSSGKNVHIEGSVTTKN